MLRDVGYIGYGFVGKACEKAFKDNSNSVIVDPKHSTTTWEEFIEADTIMTFVALPAPTLDDGSVDASLIYKVFAQLNDAQYKGIIILKSTLPPAIVEDLYVKYGSEPALNKVGTLRYVYSPEFLREASWEKDAIEPPQIILAGNYWDCEEVKNIYIDHSRVKHTRWVHTDYTTAALAKYAINCFLATKVTFMNELYQLYKDEQPFSQPEIWKDFIEILGNDIRMGHSHMKVPGPDGQFGYGGTCFPKDMKAMAGFDKNGRMSLIRDAIEANTKHRLTGNGSES